MSDALVEIPLDNLHESPFNPRQAFDDADLQELANNIKAEGRILQPLLVRPRVPALFANSGDEDAIVGYELVFGHRRLRAAALAGLATAPCMVRSMTDGEVKRAQISENLQRKDVTPLEEANAFRVLIDEHGEDQETIAQQTGKSLSFVYGRLQLLQLCPEVLKSLKAGEVGADVALLLARLRTPKLQEKALSYIKGKAWDLGDGGKRSVRSIKSLLNEHFTLDLKKAPFDIEAEMLVPLAGNCVRCPKRTGNAPHFADVAEGKSEHHYSRTNYGPNVCTDPDCFAAKKAAHQKLEADKLREKGEEVIAGAKARQLVDASGNVKGGFIALTAVKADLQAATKKAKAEGKAAPQVVTIQNPRDGKTVKAIKVADLQAAGVKVKDPSPKDPYAAQRAKAEKARVAQEALAEVENQVRGIVLDRTLAAMRDHPRTVVELLWMAQVCFDGVSWSAKNALAKRHGLAHPEQLEKQLGQWPADRLALFAVECMLIDEARVEYYELDRNKGERLFASAKHYGVDVAAIRAEVQTPGEAAPTPSPAARAPKGAKKAKAAAGAKKPAAKGKAAEGDLASSAGQEQTDDAGSAGGRDATHAASLEAPEAV